MGSEMCIRDSPQSQLSLVCLGVISNSDPCPVFALILRLINLHLDCPISSILSGFIDRRLIPNLYQNGIPAAHWSLGLSPGDHRCYSRWASPKSCEHCGRHLGMSQALFSCHPRPLSIGHDMATSQRGMSWEFDLIYRKLTIPSPCQKMMSTSAHRAL